MRKKFKFESEPINKLTYQDLTGMKAMIIGRNDLQPTTNLYGTSEPMFKLIGRVGTIEDLIVENEYYTDENGEELPGIDFVEGVIMFDYSWAIEDIEVISKKEKIKSKSLTFNPKKLFEGPKENGHQHKRVSDGSGNKRGSKNKQSKRNPNKTTTKRSSK